MTKSVKSIIEGLKPRVPTHLAVVLEKAAVEDMYTFPRPSLLIPAFKMQISG